MRMTSIPISEFNRKLRLLRPPLNSLTRTGLERSPTPHSGQFSKMFSGCNDLAIGTKVITPFEVADDSDHNIGDEKQGCQV